MCFNLQAVNERAAKLTCKIFSKNFFRACRKQFNFVNHENNDKRSPHRIKLKEFHLLTHNQQLQDHACEVLKFQCDNELLSC